MQHHQELAYPTQEGWLEALQNMMEKFFADTRQRSFVRRLAVSTLSECIAACRAYRNDGKYFKRKRERACNRENMQSRIWKATVDLRFEIFDSSSLFQTCFIVFVTYLFYFKTPKQVIF